MEVRLPELGEDAKDTARVSFWYYDVGERVEEGEDLVEMVTDKATFNIPAPATGTLKEIVVAEGEEARVGDILAIIEEE